MNAATTSSSNASRLEAVSLFLADFRVPISFVLFSALVAWEGVDGRLMPEQILPWLAAPGLGVALVLAGIGLRTWAAGTLRKGQSLATVGPYSLCRHPLYLGSGLMMCGFCQLTCSPWHYVPAVLALAVVYGNTMLREERVLRKKYPRDWPDYHARTPFCLPWLPHLYTSGAWSLAQWRKNHEYRACTTSLGGLLLVLGLRWCEQAGWLRLG